MKHHFFKHTLANIIEGYSFTNRDKLNTKCIVVKRLSDQHSIIDFHTKKGKGRKIVKNDSILNRSVKFVDYYKLAGITNKRKTK